MTSRALSPCVLGLDGETLSAWRDGLLLADESRRIARHTPGCASCQRNLGDFEIISSLLNGQRAPSLRAEVWDGVRRRIMDGGQRRFFVGGGRIWGSAAAAIVVVTLVGLFAALLARGPLGGPPGSGTPGPTTTPCQTPTPFTGPTPTVTPFSAQTPTPGGAPGPCQSTPQPGTTPTPTPGQANAYEQLGWTATPGIGTVGIPRVVFAPSAPTVGYICGASTLGGIELAKTTDSGASWKTISAPSLSGDCRLSVDPTDARDVVANDGNPFTSTILRSRDGGAWQKQSVGELAFQNWGWAGSTFLVATQVTENPVHSETDLYRSVNGGAFTRIDVNGTLAGEQLGQLRLITGKGSTIYLVDGLLQFDPDATQVSSKTYRSLDGGAHWQVVQFAGAGGQIYLIDATPDGKTFLGLDANNTRQAEVSRDSGATWQKLPAPPTQNFSRLWVAPDGTAFATVYPQGDQRIWMAKPGDAQWSAVATLPPNGFLQTIQWEASGHPTALWANYGTDDRGSAWFLLSHPLS